MGAPAEEKTEDAVVFGVDQYVYCRAHRAPHGTGWCTVGVDDKVSLGIPVTHPTHEGFRLAQEKCRKLGLKLFVDTQ